MAITPRQRHENLVFLLIFSVFSVTSVVNRFFSEEGGSTPNPKLMTYHSPLITSSAVTRA